MTTGGISTAKQCEYLIRNGASLIGMATQLIKNPFQLVAINRALSKRNS